MSRTLRPVAALALVALIGLIVAGCGSDASSGAGTDSTTASGSSAAAGTNTGSSADTGDTKKLTPQEKGVKFAECMRANGVPHFPDPDPSGETNFGIDVTPKVFTRAVEACKALKPPGALSAKRTPKQQTASLRFAQCIRDNGVPDFPDPVNGQPLVDTTAIPGPDTPEFMAILNSAMEKCGYILKLSAGGQGSGGSGG